MLNYIKRKRCIADSLARNLHPISDEDLVGYILSGLDSSNGAFSTAFMMKSEDVSDDDMAGLLLQEEARLEQEHTRHVIVVPHTNTSTSLLSSSYAFTTNRFSNQSLSKTYKGLDSFTTRNSDNCRHRPTCQLCSKPGHEAIDCWQQANHTDFPSHRSNPRVPQRQAHIAQSGSSSTVMDPSWYFDTDATNYVTLDLQKLTIVDDYTGDDKLQVGNGNHLPISHVGSCSLPNLCLPSVFIVPKLLAQSSLPKYFEHAFKSTTYLHNRTITSLLHFQSPYQKLSPNSIL
ncbi:PREDICTED: uncharacterized protein LOC109347036 [Lupinus angustifolius]|uniref:uncharacterized protein LOC109347036 n=1 Tax=Lupinus angustifolius TaxID=3871 RepID=UPI00092EDB7E|nr:PREDICTED: uncharacterized protein LOC109347036 [Lupinus angustifolius]